MRFLAHFRQQHAGEKGALQAAGVQWKALTEAQRAPWAGPYEAEKKVYEAALKEYTDSGKLASWKRDPEKPKRPMTAFLQFAQELRAKQPHLKVTESCSMAGTTWKTFTDQEKAPYERRSAEELARYTTAKEAYNKSGKGEAWKERKGLATAAAGKAKPKAAAKRASPKAAGAAKVAPKVPSAEATKAESAKA